MPTGLPRRALAVTAVAAVGLVLLLAVAIRYEPVRSFDRWSSDGLIGYGHDHPGWAAAAWWVTQWGGHVAAAVILLPTVVWLGAAHRWLAVGYAVVAVLATGPLVEAVKYLVRRPRPQPVESFAHFASYAFPSGHAAHAAAEVLVLWILLLPVVAGRGARTVVPAVTVGVVAVLAVGWSRVALGAHYPTDVVAGWALGVAWAAGTAWLAIRMSTRTSTRAGRNR